jgi:gliding motility-associated-like protein
MSSVDESCFGFADGSATATVQNPSGTYTYAWSNGGNTPTISGLTGGTFVVTVTQNGNCSTMDSVTISAPAAILLSAPTVTDVSCFGGNNGSITITASGGAGNITYLWNNGGTTATIGSLTANSYTLVATDADNCSMSAGAVVNQPTQLSLTASHTNVNCFGGNNGTASVSSTGGTGTVTFAWSNGGTGSSITGLTAGSYTVTGTDANMCTAGASVIVTQPALLTLSATPVHVMCFGTSTGGINTATTGGSGNNGYLWNTGATAVHMTGAAAGSYSVTITDANSCQASASAVISEPTQLTMAETITHVSCFGGNNGGVNLTIGGGSATYSYLWNTGGQVEDMTGASSGQYAVTVNDGNNCSITGAFNILQPTPITFGPSVVTNVNCYNGNDGTALVTPTGGTGSYTYTWNGASGPNPQTALPQGTYNIVVTDSFACTAATSVIVTHPTLLTTSALAADATCFDGYNGAVASNPTGGTPPYEFLWNDAQAQTTQNALALNAGTYTVTATDANGCTATATDMVNEPTEMNFSLHETAVLCPGDENGEIEVAPLTGGNPPYNYSATQDGSNFVSSTDSLIMGLATGYYAVIVSDNNGCTKVDTAFVPDAVADAFAVDSVSTSCYGTQYQDGSLHINGTTSINMPYEYSVDGSPLQYSPDFYFLGAGAHQVTAVNHFGCTTNFTAIVPEPVDASVDILPGDTTIQIGDVIQLFASFGPYAESAITAYQWSPSEGLSCIDCPNPQVSTYAGNTTYTLTIVYNNSCIATATALVSAEGNPEVFIPNTFTPNGDGNNDVFRVFGNNIAILELDVFNRWGEKVCTFYSQYDGWDGTYQTELQQPGVYIYNASITYLNGKKTQHSGSVTLVR